MAEKENADLKAGSEFKVDLFKVGAKVDVTGTTIGKGFAGMMKRHNFARPQCVPRCLGLAPHAGLHRPAPDAGPRVPGKRMSGHMGSVRRTIEGLKVVEVDVERNLLLIRGAVPGAEGGEVVVRPSVKAVAQLRRKYVAPTKAQVTGKAVTLARPERSKPPWLKIVNGGAGCRFPMQRSARNSTSRSCTRSSLRIAMAAARARRRS